MSVMDGSIALADPPTRQAGANVMRSCFVRVRLGGREDRRLPLLGLASVAEVSLLLWLLVRSVRRPVPQLA
jgi:hypothetical protein